MTCRRRLSCCWLRTPILFSRMKTSSNSSTKRRTKSNYWERNLTMSTITPISKSPKRRRSSTTSTSRIKNTKYKLKSYYQKYHIWYVDHSPSKWFSLSWQSQETIDSSLEKSILKLIHCSDSKPKKKSEWKQWNSRIEHQEIKGCDWWEKLRNWEP